MKTVSQMTGYPKEMLIYSALWFDACFVRPE
jgi:hypothetical protein